MASGAPLVPAVIPVEDRRALVTLIESGTPVPDALVELGLTLPQYNKTRRVNEKFATAVRRAMRDDTHRMLYESIQIADGDGDDTVVVGEKVVTDHGKIQRDRLRVDTRLKVIGMVNPTEFGPKQEVRLEGHVVLSAASILPDEDPPVENQIVEAKVVGIEEAFGDGEAQDGVADKDTD